MRRNLTLFITLTIATISLAAATRNLALAHDGATGIVKERMDAMEEMSKQSKKITRIIKNKEPIDTASLINTADLFLKHGNKMQSLFPDSEHSRMKSEALPAVWEDWQDFTRRIDEFVLLSKNLKTQAESNATNKELTTAFRDTALSCRGCHKKYRKRKKK